MTTVDLKKRPEVDQSEARRHWVLREHHAWAVRRWWQRLSLSAEALKGMGSPPGWPKGVKAELRRCGSPEAAMLTEGFRHLWLALDDNTLDVYSWAGVAMLLADLREERIGVTLPMELGKKKGEAGKPRMSELRFQQLIESQSFEELLQRMRRSLALIEKRGVSVVHIAADVLQWQMESNESAISIKPSQRIKFLWANDYFRQVVNYRSSVDE